MVESFGEVGDSGSDGFSMPGRVYVDVLKVGVFGDDELRVA